MVIALQLSIGQNAITSHSPGLRTKIEWLMVWTFLMDAKKDCIKTLVSTRELDQITFRFVLVLSWHAKQLHLSPYFSLNEDYSVYYIEKFYVK